jgi:hypothetical protein
MLEPIIGLVVCVAMYLGVWLASKVTSEFRRDEAFERWCATAPMIMAFRTRDPSEARIELRALLEPHGEVVNLQGGVPWQYYRYDVELRIASDDVVTLHIKNAIVQRGRGKQRMDAAKLVDAIVHNARAKVHEVWIHGQLQPSDAKSATRDKHSWLARVENGALDVHPMIGRPEWAYSMSS